MDAREDDRPGTTDPGMIGKVQQITKMTGEVPDRQRKRQAAPG